MYDFILRLIDLSKTGILIILGILIIRFFLKKAPKKYSYFLWIVVAFRLLCPFSIESNFSVFNVEKVITPMVKNETILSEVITYTQPLYYENRINEDIAATLGPDADPIKGYLPDYFFWWFAILAFIFVCIITSYFDVRDRVKEAIRIEGNVYESDRIHSPFVFGIVFPKIYIPKGMDKKTMDIVLKHERYHIQRKDHLFRLLALCITAIYWFNPFVWLAYQLFIEDMEMSCDEHVLGEINAAKTYSYTLLSMATNQSIELPKPLAFGEKSISKRIKNILKWKEPKKMIKMISIVLCLITLVTFTSNPTKQDNLFDLLEKYDIRSFDTLRLQIPGVDHHDVTFNNWLHFQIFDKPFDLVQVSKFETEPTNESIHVIMTFTDANHEVKLSFPTSFDLCIVETDHIKTAYRIINHDVAKSMLEYGHDRETCWGAGEAIKNVQVFNSHISIKETFTADDGIYFEKEGYIQIPIIDTDSYIIDCDYVIDDKQITFISKDNDDILVFDIEHIGYEIVMTFDEKASKVASERVVEILNQMYFTNDFQNAH